MCLLTRLGFKDTLSSHHLTSLQQIFRWFIGCNIPYETVSNFVDNLFIKDADKMATAIENSYGGHCVEHAVILTEILRENKFDAKLVNADFLDHIKNIKTTIAKSLVIIQMAKDIYVCDPYYRAVLLPVPNNGQQIVGDYRLKRLDEITFIIQSFKNGVLINEDLVRENCTLAVRQKQFCDRYQYFFPFGITAPYYQVLHPIRKALYYEPIKDRLLMVQQKQSYYLNDEDIEQCEWIPSHIRKQVSQVMTRNRIERNEAIKFLQLGIHTPNYIRPV